MATTEPIRNKRQIKELAEYLRLTVQTIQRWVINRELPYHKIKKVIRFRVSEIEKWISEGGWKRPDEKPAESETSLFDDVELPGVTCATGSSENNMGMDEI